MCRCEYLYNHIYEEDLVINILKFTEKTFLCSVTTRR